MHNFKLLIFFSDELKTIQCRSDDPASFVLRIPGFDPEILTDSIHLRLEWHKDDTGFYVPVEFISQDGSDVIFKPCGEIQKQERELYHLIEVNEFIQYQKIDKSEVMDYKAKADYINKKYRNTLTSQIKQLMMEENLTNQFIFKLLLQIDSKLDDLLASRKEEEESDLTSTRMLSLSGGGMCFITDNAEVDDILFFQTDTKYSAGFTFAALARVKNIIRTNAKVICETDFINIDETTRDGIIRRVFEKDREKLKRKSI